MNRKNFEEFVSYLYIDDLTQHICYDYCYNCDNIVHQEDDGNGVFRCEFCHTYNKINIIVLRDWL